MGRTLIGGSAVAAPTTPTEDTSSVVDPRKEGLPCIATWSMQDDNARRFNCVVYNSNGHMIGAPWGNSQYSSPNDYGGGIMYDKYFGSSGDNGNPFRTNSQISSNNSSYIIQSTTKSSHWPQHAMMNVSADGMFGSNRWTSGNGMQENMRFMITHVLPEGIRPRLAIQRSGTYLYRSDVMYGPNANSPGGERFDIWDDPEAVAEFTQNAMSPKSISSSHNQGIGACGYNERTKTLVILWNRSSNTTRYITKWKFTKCLNDPKVPLREVFMTASSVEMSATSLNMGWSGTSEAYRWEVTVGDNDYIRCSNFQPSSRYRTYLVTPDLTLEGGEGTNAQSYINNTTSYGIEQGWPHIGSQYNSTWDNKWHIHYSHYYYYGAGISSFFTSTEDPRVYYKWEQQSSNGGRSPHAWGRTGFIFSYTDGNADSSDVHFYKVDFRGMKTTTDAIAEGAGYYFSNTERAQPSNASALSISGGSGLFPSHGYHTTNYPTFLNVTWWPTADGRTSYSGDTR